MASLVRNLSRPSSSVESDAVSQPPAGAGNANNNGGGRSFPPNRALRVDNDHASVLAVVLMPAADDRHPTRHDRAVEIRQAKAGDSLDVDQPDSDPRLPGRRVMDKRAALSHVEPIPIAPTNQPP